MFKQIIYDYLENNIKKQEIIKKYIDVLSDFLNIYYEEIKQNSNYTILKDLKGDKLVKYGNRYGVVKKPRWREGTFKRAISIARKNYEADLSIIDNFYELITKPTNYKADIKYRKYAGESGAIEVDVVIPPSEPMDLLNDLEKLFVYGCRVDYNVRMELLAENIINYFTTIYLHKDVKNVNDWRF